MDIIQSPYSEILTVFQQFDNEISKLDKRLIDFKARYNGKEIPDNVYLAINIQQKGIHNLDAIKDYLFNYIQNQNHEINSLRRRLFEAKETYTMNLDNKLAIQAAILRPPTHLGQVLKNVLTNLDTIQNGKAKAS